MLEQTFGSSLLASAENRRTHKDELVKERVPIIGTSLPCPPVGIQFSNSMKHTAIESSLSLCVIIEVTMLRGYMVK